MIDEEKRIRSKAQLKDWLNWETRHYPTKGKARVYNLLLLSENAILRRHIILLRKAEYYINTGSRVLSKIYKMRLELFQLKYGMHIPPNVFEKGLRVMHVGEIHVNGNARAGENCIIHVHTSLAAGGFNDGTPTLGNGVTLFMGAIVCGNIFLADNVVVGANSVVTGSVYEENTTVAGNPAAVVGRKGRVEMERGKT